MAGDPVITYEYPDEVPGEVFINVRAEDLTTTNTAVMSHSRNWPQLRALRSIFKTVSITENMCSYVGRR